MKYVHKYPLSEIRVTKNGVVSLAEKLGEILHGFRIGRTNTYNASELHLCFIDAQVLFQSAHVFFPHAEHANILTKKIETYRQRGYKYSDLNKRANWNKRFCRFVVATETLSSD